jgi:hypothetical protein
MLRTHAPTPSIPSPAKRIIGSDSAGFQSSRTADLNCGGGPVAVVFKSFAGRKVGLYYEKICWDGVFGDGFEHGEVTY